MQWNQENTLQLVLTEQQLSERTLSVKIAYNSHPFVEVLRISLYLIVHGPYHHSIQIPFNNENFRILFDAKISHIIEANLCVKELKIYTLDSVDTCSCHFTIKALVQTITFSMKKRFWPSRHPAILLIPLRLSQTQPSTKIKNQKGRLIEGNLQG